MNACVRDQNSYAVINWSKSSAAEKMLPRKAFDVEKWDLLYSELFVNQEVNA